MKSWHYAAAALLPAALFVLAGCGGKEPNHGWVEKKPETTVIKSTQVAQTRVNIGAPPESIKKVMPPDAKLPKLAALQVVLPAEWRKEWLDNTNQWVIDKPEKVQPGGEIRPQTRVRVSRSPAQVEPSTLAEYTKFLLKADEENMIFPQVVESGQLPDGFYIVARCRMVADVTATELDLGFVVVRTINGDRIKFKCHRLADDNTRQEALALCKSAHF